MFWHQMIRIKVSPFHRTKGKVDPKAGMDQIQSELHHEEGHSERHALC